MNPPTDIIIIGAGMAGCSAALWCRRLDLKFAWFEQAALPGGQLSRIHNRITDYPGLTVLNGEAFRSALLSQLEELGVKPALNATITEVTLEAGRVRLSDGTEHTARGLILAMGVETRQLGVPGEVTLQGRGVSYSATRDRQAFAGKSVAVVGGGDAACENALLLAEVCPRVTLIHRRESFRARAALLDRVRAEPRIDVLTGTRAKAIGGHDHVESIRLETPEGERTLTVAGVFVRIGVGPNSRLVTRQVKCDPDGYVRVDADQCTSVPLVYAVGDLCSPVYSSLAAAGGQGMVAAKAAARSLASGSAS